ncbi:CHAT domain-containing protein [Candidatus Protochlamydia amoebophila]|uniref:CHAT domain-containing protein n=1 Tax=Candidatus Protochlamydia amoebophila TaxID=362787 RepID=UPI0000352D27
MVITALTYLFKIASEEKIEPVTPKNIEKAVLRLFQSLPEAIAKEIEKQKPIIHKTGKMSSRILEIMILVCSDQGDFPRAIFHAEVFLEFLRQKRPEMSQKEKLIIRIMQIHRNLAVWNQILGQNQIAIFHEGEALKAAQELHNSPAIITCLKNIGCLYVKQGKNELALPFYQEAQAIAQTLQDPKSESKILTDLADAYLSIDKNDEAISCFQAALNLAENKFEQALICIGIGNVHANDQCYQLAKEAYQKALHFCPQDNVFLAIIIHEKFANFFDNFGRYEKAISHAEKILELIQHPSVQKKESKALDSKLRALTILGNIYGTFGDYARELDYHTQALEINEKPNFFSQSLEITYGNLGNAYGNVKNYSKSIDYYNKALRITKDVTLRAKIFLNMANVWGELGKFDKTIELYEEANKIGNLEIKRHSLLGLGVCYDIMGNKEQAIQCIEKSICLSQASKDRLNEAVGYHNLAELYTKFDLGLAEENYRKSIAISAALHQELKNHHQWQITFFEEQAKTILSLEILLLKQSKNEEALQVTDFRRSRALVSALTEKFPFQKIDSLTSSGLTAREMQALAQKLNTCFIVYSLSPEDMNNITAWVIPSQGEITCQQLPLEILGEDIKETTHVFKKFPFIVEPTVAKRRPFLRPKKTRSSATYAFLNELTRGDPDESANSAVLQSFKERLSLWYEALIAPLESYLPKDPQQVITIIPNGFLAQIPFAAFLDKEGTYLIEKHPISIAPSVGILKLLDEIPKDFSENSLVIGNPTTPHLKDKLPLAKKEAQTIVAPLLKTIPERTLLQDSAVAQRVLEGMRDARWIHLACHGSTGEKPEEKLDPHSVFEGLFKLAPDKEHIQGYLHAQEIATLRLRTELVFMSACFSGRGKLHEEGSVGPVWSFLAAGALSTIATYWRLPDSDLTLQMVETFYRHLLGIEVEKLNKAQALQKSMLMAIRQEREQPHLWGAFFLSGLHE